jgi:hypothetical protein
VRQDGATINMVLLHFDIDLGRAWEERTSPMIFVAASCDGQSAVFDGQGEHAGEHLTYKRTGRGAYDHRRLSAPRQARAR